MEFNVIVFNSYGRIYTLFISKYSWNFRNTGLLKIELMNIDVAFCVHSVFGWLDRENGIFFPMHNLRRTELNTLYGTDHWHHGGIVTCCCCWWWLAEGGDDPRTTGEMKWGEWWDEDDVVPLVAREEKANSGDEGYEGKESKLICSGGRSLNWGSPARNWETWRGIDHISPRARSVGWVEQLKRWATVWSVERQSGQVGSSAQPTEWR